MGNQGMVLDTWTVANAQYDALFIDADEGGQKDFRQAVLRLTE
jgi:predicted O-methyltransferase YrrM